MPRTEERHPHMVPKALTEAVCSGSSGLGYQVSQAWFSGLPIHPVGPLKAFCLRHDVFGCT